MTLKEDGPKTEVRQWQPLEGKGGITKARRIIATQGDKDEGQTVQEQESGFNTVCPTSTQGGLLVGELLHIQPTENRSGGPPLPGD